MKKKHIFLTALLAMSIITLASCDKNEDHSNSLIEGDNPTIPSTDVTSSTDASNKSTGLPDPSEILSDLTSGRNWGSTTSTVKNDTGNNAPSPTPTPEPTPDNPSDDDPDEAVYDVTLVAGRKTMVIHAKYGDRINLAKYEKELLADDTTEWTKVEWKDPQNPNYTVNDKAAPIIKDKTFILNATRELTKDDGNYLLGEISSSHKYKGNEIVLGTLTTTNATISKTEKWYATSVKKIYESDASTKYFNVVTGNMLTGSGGTSGFTRSIYNESELAKYKFESVGKGIDYENKIVEGTNFNINGTFDLNGNYNFKLELEGDTLEGTANIDDESYDYTYESSSQNISYQYSHRVYQYNDKNPQHSCVGEARNKFIYYTNNENQYVETDDKTANATEKQINDMKEKLLSNAEISDGSYRTLIVEINDDSGLIVNQYVTNGSETLAIIDLKDTGATKYLFYKDGFVYELNGDYEILSKTESEPINLPYGYVYSQIINNQVKGLSTTNEMGTVGETKSSYYFTWGESSTFKYYRATINNNIIEEKFSDNKTGYTITTVSSVTDNNDAAISFDLITNRINNYNE